MNEDTDCVEMTCADCGHVHSSPLVDVRDYAQCPGCEKRTRMSAKCLCWSCARHRDQHPGCEKRWLMGAKCLCWSCARYREEKSGGCRCQLCEFHDGPEVHSHAMLQTCKGCGHTQMDRISVHGEEALAQIVAHGATAVRCRGCNKRAGWLVMDGPNSSWQESAIAERVRVPKPHPDTVAAGKFYSQFRVELAEASE